MSDIAGVCSAPIIGEARARGLDPMQLVAGLGHDLCEFEDPGGRVPWSAFVIFAERAANMLGEETLEELAATATVEFVPAPIRRILPWLGDSRRLFTFAARWWGPWVFHGTRGRCEVLPDGRLREVVQILPEYPACPQFLSGIAGTLRAMPRLLGQADAHVSLEQDGREGVFLITPPPPRTRSTHPVFAGRDWFARSGRFGTRRQRAQAAQHLEEIGVVREQLRDNQRRTESMKALFDMQSRSLSALQQLGLTLVQDGDVDSLQQDIVRFVQQYLGVGGVRLSLYGPEGEPMRKATSGSLPGLPADTLRLNVADRNIGLLEIWDFSDEDSIAALHDLRPWIAIVLENGRSRMLAGQLMDLLAQDVQDWERMEQRVERAVVRLDNPRIPSPEGFVWPVFRLEPVDLTQFFHALAPRLRQLIGGGVQLDVRCAEGLSPAVFERSDLETFVENVVGVLDDIGSEQISIETRAVAELPYPEFSYTTAEVQVWGRGGSMQPASRARLGAILELADTGMLVADLNVRSDFDGAVGVCIRMPLIALAPSGEVH